MGEGLPSPLTPLPWASGSENCLLDPPSKVGVRLLLDVKKTPQKPQKCMHRFTQLFNQGGREIQPTLFIQSLGPKICQDPPRPPQDPPKTPPRPPKALPRWPKMVPRWSKMVPRWLQNGPKIVQDGPKTTQDGEKSTPGVSKI